jgi:NAD(P)-dependent dehydrogenase (short-subunit alcohol dehydrogenase family)
VSGAAAAGFPRQSQPRPAHQREIRMHAVAPGPVWTPLIPSTLSPESVEKFGTDSSEVLAPIGGETLPG